VACKPGRYPDRDGLSAFGGRCGLNTQALPLLKRSQTSRTDDRRVDEDVLEPVVDLDKSEALGRVEPLDLAQDAYRSRGTKRAFGRQMLMRKTSAYVS